MSASSTDEEPGASAPSGPPVCPYNVSWINKTFSTRRKCESLLGPELENGNLSRKDFDALLRNIPGIPYTDFIGPSTALICAVLGARRRPRLENLSSIAGLAGYAVGSTFGESLRLLTHHNFFRSIEDINGFARAMDNVKRKVGYTPGAVTFTRPLRTDSDFAMEQPPFLQPETVSDMPFEPQLQSSPGALERGSLQESVASRWDEIRAARRVDGQGSNKAPAAAPSSQTPPPAKSRWDEIRNVRRGDGPGKAWENIRHGRPADGSPLLVPNQRGPNAQGEPTPYRDDDRAAAQASFDALLERERNMSSEK